MTRRPGGSALPRIALASLGFVAVLGTLAGPAAAGVRATRAAAQPSGTLAIEIHTITPAVPTETSTLTISGAIHNSGSTRISPVDVTLAIGNTPLVFRGQLDEVEAGALGPTRPVPGGQAVITDEIGPQDFAPFRLAVPISAFGLPQSAAGVYQLDLTAAASQSGVSKTTVTTFLPWVPNSETIAPTRLAWLWPLVDRPVRDSAGIFTNDRLAGSLAPGGRLRGLVDAAAGSPVTWVVDPDLLETAAQMSQGYQVRARGGSTAPGSGQDAATDWLDHLRSGIGSAEVVNLPYGDVDLTALRRNQLTEDIQRANMLGAETARSVLHRPTDSDVAWPPGDLTDRPTMEAVRAADQHAIILADSALPAADSLNYTPTGRGRLTTAAGDLDALLIDTGLSAVLRDGSGSKPGVGALMIQRFLAETALITLQRPNDPRSLVVAAPRYWPVNQETADQLLRAAASAPWLTSVPLSSVRDVEPPAVSRTVAEYPASARAAELPGAYLATVRRMRTQLLHFTDVLSNPGPTERTYTAARLRSESASWRRTDGEPGVTAAGRSYLRRVAANLTTLRGQVSIVSGGTVTLSSHTGTIPVTVRNELPQQVTIQVFVDSTREDRLQVEQPELAIVPAGGVAPISVRAEAVANGLVEVRVRLHNPGGEPISDFQSIRVQVTNYGTLGSVIIAAATTLLFLSATTRIVRRSVAGRRRRATRSAATPAESVEPEQRVEV
ncbi:MAG TPA: DUF6049 family protein [Actinomycetes bacterium]|nr:DUF6049 family protein [Actinomycetes bacterium]